MFEEAGLPDPLPVEPLPLLAAWLAEARSARRTPNPDAMILATVRPDGQPAARVVLCKAIDLVPGELVFFTNYESAKAREIEASPRVCAVFHFDYASRQARVYGRVHRGSAEESDAYFSTRPLLSRIGAWASRQSQTLASREDLMLQSGEVMAKFGVTLEQAMADLETHAKPSGGVPAASVSTPVIPRPPHWGAYRIKAESVELWVGHAGRLHDRAVWRTGSGGAWQVERLQP